MDNDQKSPQPIIPWYFWAIAAGLVVLWSLTIPVVKWMGFGSPDGAGTFGDTFGALNTLFSGLAFLGVLAGIFIQGREFRSQLEEMRIAAAEMEKQSIIYDAQLESLKRQNLLIGRQFIEAHFREQMKSQPIWSVDVKVDDTNLILLVHNEGEIAYNVEFSSSVCDEPRRFSSWVDHNQAVFLPYNRDKIGSCKVSIRYTTRLGYDRTEHFDFGDGMSGKGVSQIQEHVGTEVTSVREIATQIRSEIEYEEPVKSKI
jgi:hypothetical protein